VVFLILPNESIMLQGSIAWFLRQASCELPVTTDEFSSRQVIGVPDVSVGAFVSELPALFKAFEEAVARGRPKTLPNKSLQATATAP